MSSAVPRRILVRAPNWVGDQILAFPFFHFLRRAYPRAHVGVACVPWVASLQFRDLVNEVFTLPKPASRSLLHRHEAIEAATARIRAKGKWDLGICLPDSFSSAWTMWRSGCTQRRGFVGDGRSLLLTQRLEPQATHRAQAYLELLPVPPESTRFYDVQQFWGIAPDNDLDPTIPGVLPRFDAGRAWPSSEVGEPLVPPTTPYWVVAPGSMAESRQWPMERFVALARLIHTETGMKGLIVGGPGEKGIAAQLAGDPSTGLEDWVARGTPAALHRVFGGAQFTVSNDSGLAHVASLCGSPTQIVWGAGDPKVTEPIGPGKARVLFNPVDCWPCVRNTCSQMPERYLDCLKGIEPQSVWKEIQSGLRPRLAQATHP